MENTQTNNILMVKDLRVSYSQEAGSVFRPKKDLDVLKGVSFSIREGEGMGLVGESGCGKSTLSKALLGLIPKYEGVIVQKSEHPQMIFQDPFSSLNPAKKVGWILEEPLRLNTGLNRVEREKKVSEMLRRGGLEEKLAQRYPRQLSGGQRQRVAIGRALITDPDILLMDEPFSSLDALTREHLQTTVLSLWQRRRPTCVLVTHNVPEAVFLGKHVMVMNGHPARNVMWLENPCFGDADPRGEERYFSLTKKVYAALSETKDFSCPH